MGKLTVRIPVLEMVAETDRRNLLSLGGKELAAELTRRRVLITAMIDQGVRDARAHAKQVEEDYEKKAALLFKISKEEAL